MSISTTKRLLAALIAIVFTVATAKAQAPQKMSFQSVVRNSSGTLVTNHSVGLRLSILQGSINGTAVYVETQTATANANGLVTLQIGGGTVVTGTFSAIDWSAGPYYIKSEIDPTGGIIYGIAGTTQLLSVAYALYAEKSGTPGPIGATGAKGDSGISVRNTFVNGDSLYVTLSTGQTLNAGNVRGLKGDGFQNGTFNGQMLYWNGSIWELINTGTQSQILTFCNGIPTWTTNGQCPGTISSLNCANTVQSDSIYKGITITNVKIKIPYAGGNGGPYNSQSIISNNVTGLTASLVAGNFSNGADTLTLTISGTANSSGIAFFNLNLGGQSCNINLNIQQLVTGSTYQGGLIAYLDTSSGYHGFVVSNNIGTALWGLEGPYGAMSLDDGYSNTNFIVSTTNSPNISGVICRNLSLNGYNDWYLPAKNQMSLIYQNIFSKGLVSILGSYWSSSAYSSNWAYIMRSDGTWGTGSKQGGYLNIVAIRNF